MANNQCRCGTCNPDCLKETPQIWKIELMGGVQVTPDEARTALQEAMTIIECVGTTGIHDKYPFSNWWMKKYFPNWAD